MKIQLSKFYLEVSDTDTDLALTQTHFGKCERKCLTYRTVSAKTKTHVLLKKSKSIFLRNVCNSKAHAFCREKKNKNCIQKKHTCIVSFLAFFFGVGQYVWTGFFCVNAQVRNTFFRICRST